MRVGRRAPRLPAAPLPARPRRRPRAGREHVVVDRRRRDPRPPRRAHRPRRDARRPSAATSRPRSRAASARARSSARGPAEHRRLDRGRRRRCASRARSSSSPSVNFLGLGLQPPAADWALMISREPRRASSSSRGVVAPAVLIALLTIAVNLVADARRAHGSAARDVAERAMSRGAACSPSRPARRAPSAARRSSRRLARARRAARSSASSASRAAARPRRARAARLRARRAPASPAGSVAVGGQARSRARRARAAAAARPRRSRTSRRTRRRALNPALRIGDADREMLRGTRRRATTRPASEALERVAPAGRRATSARRYPHQLSGGQQQRVAIAAALVGEPPRRRARRADDRARRRHPGAHPGGDRPPAQRERGSRWSTSRTTSRSSRSSPTASP